MNFYLNCINNNFPRHATSLVTCPIISSQTKRSCVLVTCKTRRVEQGAADDHRGNKIHRESRFTV